MITKPLVINGKKYRGQFVATRSFKDRIVISSGKNPAKVLKEAKRQGAVHPVIMFIPEKNMAYLY